MARFGLIGRPISHSKSPALFGAAYTDSDTYELIEADSLEESLKIFLESDIRGINVTSPYKDEVMEYVSSPDRISSLLGSANVLVKGERRADGKLEILSYNTDYYGVKRTVSEFLEKGQMPGALKNRKIENVLVVGAGGAGKAAALAMVDMGYRVFIANRSAGRVADFVLKTGAEYVPLERVGEFVEKSDIIIYSLSFLVDGMKSADLSEKIVFEANYAAPTLSPESGVVCGTYIGGRWWLYNQAVPAFEIFTGRQPDLQNMRKIIGVE